MIKTNIGNDNYVVRCKSMQSPNLKQEVIRNEIHQLHKYMLIL